MASALKDVYSESFYKVFFQSLKKVSPQLDENDFLAAIFVHGWELKELKERMRHTAHVLRKILDPDYPEAVKQIVAIIDKQIREKTNGFNFEYLFFPDFIQVYGLKDYETSIAGIEKITQYTSCEFVVRHFIVEYPEKMISQMTAWAKHEHHYVRRLASEGMRTRLPWAIGVPLLKNNPDLIFPILETLVDDESDWVRRSVANSLNDLSKDYPEQTLDFTKRWIGHSEDVDKVLKHGARGLLKKGDIQMLRHFGINSSADLNLLDFSLQNKTVSEGENLSFSFQVHNKENDLLAVRIEYRIYFLRGNKTHHAKTFHISEKKLASDQLIPLQKKHSFKIITTRKYYSGEHFISILINGIESDKLAFELIGSN